MVAFTTLESYKTFAATGLSSTDNDAKASQLIAAVSAGFENYLNRHIVVKERTELLDSILRQKEFLLKGCPIHSVTSIKHSLTRDFDNTTALSSSEYFLDEEEGIIGIDRTALSRGRRVIQVVYVGGLALHATDYTSVLNDPPGSPSTGDTYLVGAAPTGAWADEAESLAEWDGSEWVFTTQDTKLQSNYPELMQACNTEVHKLMRNRTIEGNSYSQARSHAVTLNTKEFFTAQTLNILGNFVKKYYG